MVDLGADRALFSISVAAEVTGVSPQMLRVYEQKGLLVPHRTEGGTRRYSGHELDRIGEIKEKCEKEGKTFFYASNFSIGVNIFFAMNKYLAKIMNNFPSYDVKMTEVHHIHKLDAPSGTAITLAEGILENIDRKDRWTLENAESATDLPIHAIREGEVPGIHEITYESDVDTISIKHDAKSRAGFALGAVIAAEFTAGKKGFLGMNDLFKF